MTEKFTYTEHACYGLEQVPYAVFLGAGERRVPKFFLALSALLRIVIIGRHGHPCEAASTIAQQYEHFKAALKTARRSAELTSKPQRGARRARRR